MPRKFFAVTYKELAAHFDHPDKIVLDFAAGVSAGFFCLKCEEPLGAYAWKQEA